MAAADPVGDPALLWRAAGQLGILYEALSPAAAADLLEVDVGVRFRHPLVRSAVYRTAPRPSAKGWVHQALAEVTAPDLDPDRRAWHRAQAAAGPDEEVASELERSAGRAQARGGVAAAAAFLERAVALTLDPALRTERALAAARAKFEAAAPRRIQAARDRGASRPARSATTSACWSACWRRWAVRRGRSPPRMSTGWWAIWPALAGATSTRRNYLQVFKGFHRFLEVRKAVEIEVSFGVRLVCPVDEYISPAMSAATARPRTRRRPRNG